MTRRTVIAATLGPASAARPCVEGMVAAGLDVVRISMASGDREWQAATARVVREASAAVGRPVRLLADLQGRKNRLGGLPGGRAEWAAGDVVELTAAAGDHASHRTWTTRPWAPETVPDQAQVLIDDGAVVLAVTEVAAAAVRCVVTQGGVVTSGRGITMPGATTVAPGLTERDADDLRFARGLGAELVALSFASGAADYREVRALAPDQLIIGKVEHAGALAALPELAEAFDGLMVARGDLGLEIPFEEVPFAQKRILAECGRRGKPGMVATQLLHSMRDSALPTRAEVSDVCQAVLDGAGALLVTGETGYGRHPVRVVEVLDLVITRAERHLDEVGPQRQDALAVAE